MVSESSYRSCLLTCQTFHSPCRWKGGGGTVSHLVFSLYRFESVFAEEGWGGEGGWKGRGGGGEGRGVDIPGFSLREEEKGRGCPPVRQRCRTTGARPAGPTRIDG